MEHFSFRQPAIVTEEQIQLVLRMRTFGYPCIDSSRTATADSSTAPQRTSDWPNHSRTSPTFVSGRGQ